MARVRIPLQAVEQRRQRRRSGKDDAAIALHLFHEADPPDSLRKKSFRGQIHQREISRARWVDVLAANLLRAFFELRFQALHRVLDQLDIAFVLREQEALIIFRRKLGVDRQPDGGAIFIAGQFDGEIDVLTAFFPGAHVPRELIGRQHLLEQIAELHFAPAAARLYVRKHFLQPADVAGQLPHRPESLMDLLETIAHQLEGFAEPLLERPLQFFVDRGPHLLDLLRVLLPQFLQPRIDVVGYSPRLSGDLSSWSRNMPLISASDLSVVSLTFFSAAAILFPLPLGRAEDSSDSAQTHRGTFSPAVPARRLEVSRRRGFGIVPHSRGEQEQK